MVRRRWWDEAVFADSQEKLLLYVNLNFVYSNLQVYSSLHQLGGVQVDKISIVIQYSDLTQPVNNSAYIVYPIII